VDGRGPAIGLHGKLYFVLNLRFRELVAWIGSCIHPGSTQNRVEWVLLVSIGVLRDVVVERRTPNIVEVLQDQAVVVRTDRGAGGFPENGVGRDAINHDATAMIHEIACRIESDLGVCLVRARERFVSWKYSFVRDAGTGSFAHIRSGGTFKRLYSFLMSFSEAFFNSLKYCTKYRFLNYFQAPASFVFFKD
jgi:hypothetical protein